MVDVLISIACEIKDPDADRGVNRDGCVALASARTSGRQGAMSERVRQQTAVPRRVVRGNVPEVVDGPGDGGHVVLGHRDRGLVATTADRHDDLVTLDLCRGAAGTRLATALVQGVVEQRELDLPAIAALAPQRVEVRVAGLRTIDLDDDLLRFAAATLFEGAAGLC